jgi:hypothetical protein
MPYADPNDPRKAETDRVARERRADRRRNDPEYARRERQRDQARARSRRASESPEEREARRARQREYEALRMEREPNRKRVRSEAVLRWNAIPENRARANMQSRLRTFGLTLESFYAIKRAQDFRCAICGRNLPPPGEQWGKNDEHIDHDHKTGRVRGVLCGGCNTALGKLGDNADGLGRALHYVSEPGDPDCF